MAYLLHQLIEKQAQQRPQHIALLYRDQALDYQTLWTECLAFAAGLRRKGLSAGERVAIWLPKQLEAVVAIFGSSAATATFVPVNPLLKPKQLLYILQHCKVRVLVTSRQRLASLQALLASCPDLKLSIVVDEMSAEDCEAYPIPVMLWSKFLDSYCDVAYQQAIDADIAAIFYTSGSTGAPKGVVLSHRNLIVGAESVSNYLENSPDDRVLALLPLSFDAGFSQLSTMFLVGGTAVLMDYLLPRDVLRALAKYEITGLAAVPVIWNHLANLDWPADASRPLRYITNTGGAMPTATTKALAKHLPACRIFLMYGLTEAFRSTYLPPEQVAIRPDSIGKAIPNAQIMVVNADGEECAPGEVGELVHRGALVSLGYWNDPETTALRFRPSPGQPAELCTAELAVWSGDQVRKDSEGYLYFVSRKDDMIKTSGYRVSPSEVEEVIYTVGGVVQALALGLPHSALGQAILALVTIESNRESSQMKEAIQLHCRQELPNFMVPLDILVLEQLPANPNGKLDRKSLAAQYSSYFQELQ
ncbi:acyl-CoA ligase (AMP-forming), exosortase A system-associated [Parahaliea sp. F7430]|uniref:Acyl-CoA ligase (AMP-forming), exosortase A system-associated n=1 Tax=Sediminihaliea albiluteola TaxID=2758564 RepID=A0A7W2TVE8_9GAMM|nr:acyl-CoA ligase (AMP-forming), exosortase A system-associated [Sediminihaliea albiluteola]MBA6412681.1 acyl-CoA ligase (AMP-forming), exosortase A system-associated [Sediminihaliea albiluteola]